MAGLLNLVDADESGFDPLPPGTYVCEVFAPFTVIGTKGGEDAKLPKDTPMLKLQWRAISTRDGENEIIDDDGSKMKVENRRFFDQYVIPPKEIDGEPYEHYEMMNGRMVRLFKALGYDEKDIRGAKGFNPDPEEVVGRQALVTVGRDTKYNSNPVKGVKPLAEMPVAGLL